MFTKIKINVLALQNALFVSSLKNLEFYAGTIQREVSLIGRDNNNQDFLLSFK